MFAIFINFAEVMTRFLFLFVLAGITVFELQGSFGQLPWLADSGWICLFHLIYIVTVVCCLIKTFTFRFRCVLYKAMREFTIFNQKTCLVFFFVLLYTQKSEFIRFSYTYIVYFFLLSEVSSKMESFSQQIIYNKRYAQKKVDVDCTLFF